MRNIIFFLMISGFISCSGVAPVKDYKVTLYSILQIDWDRKCVQFIDNNNQTGVICEDMDTMPADLISISAEDYKKERDYQDLLKNRCREWK